MLNVDIIRPAASDGALDVPTIIVPSPYYESPGRGRAGKTKPPAVQILLLAGDQPLQAEIDGPDANFSAYLVDYGTAERTQHTVSGGIVDLQSGDLLRPGHRHGHGCYRDVQRRTHTQPFEVVARGWAIASFVTGEDEFVPGERHRLEWEIFTDDHVFEAGHRIGVVISGSDTSTRNPGTSSDTTVRLPASQVQLPIVGGPPALRNATR